MALLGVGLIGSKNWERDGFLCLLVLGVRSSCCHDCCQ